MVESDNGRSLDDYLTLADRETIEALVFQPSLKPSFELIRSCLVWDDERARGLSKRGNDFIRRLWVVRSFIHQGLSREHWRIDPAPFENAWNAAHRAGLKWPGFLRLHLSDEDTLYLQRSLYEASKATDY